MSRDAPIDDSARRRLDELIRLHPGESYASMSALIGRNHAYIQQYIRRGQPRRLQEGDRRAIARHFGVSEEELGGPPQRAPGLSEPDAGLVFVPRYDVRASAGHGALVDQDAVRDHLPFRAAHLKALTGAPAEHLSVLTVAGDSMYPTLADGDEILVDRSEEQPRRDAIYVLRVEETLQVKRVSVNPMTGRVTVKSDNPMYESWPDIDPRQIDLIGRVVWVGRRL